MSHTGRIAWTTLAVLLLFAACIEEATDPLVTPRPASEKTGREDRGPGDGGGRPAPHVYIWKDLAALQTLPMAGTAWSNLETYAQNALVLGGPNLGTFEVSLFDKDSDADVLALAKALVAMRISGGWTNWTYRWHVQLAIQEIMAEWPNPSAIDCTNEPLAVARNLTSYIIAADYAGLDEPVATQFRQWLGTMLDEPLSEQSDCIRNDRSLHQIMRERPNNWGTMAMAALAAVATYRNDATLLTEVRHVFDGWLGDRAEYAGFLYGDLCWQPNPTAPVGIAPVQSVIVAGTCTYPMDGALPEELRRSELCDPGTSTCSIDCNPGMAGTQCLVTACPGNTCSIAGGRMQVNVYLHGTIAGAAVCAEILSHRGYPDVWQWENQALRRAAQWLLERHNADPAMGWWFSGNDSFIPWLLNRAYGTSFPTSQDINVGRNMDFTDWTHPPQ